ncbi:response regulator [Microbacterium sp. NPDC090007]|uniref:response regulator n=1 Tax=Microbacterium sp. NPDC090007 TaxID=3364204 RepID=UPI00380EC865
MNDALVVDDDPVTRLVLTHMLRAQGWMADAAADVPDAASRLRARSYDLVISDFQLPSGTGTELLDVLGDTASTKFVLLTGIIEYSAIPVEDSQRLSARLTKPVSSEALRDVLRRVFGDGVK